MLNDQFLNIENFKYIGKYIYPLLELIYQFNVLLTIWWILASKLKINLYIIPFNIEIFLKENILILKY